MFVIVEDEKAGNGSALLSFGEESQSWKRGVGVFLWQLALVGIRGGGPLQEWLAAWAHKTGNRKWAEILPVAQCERGQLKRTWVFFPCLGG